MHEIGLLIDNKDNGMLVTTCEGISKWIHANREKLIDVLTTTETSKPKARRINGGTKKRKSTASTEQQQFNPSVAQ